MSRGFSRFWVTKCAEIQIKYFFLVHKMLSKHQEKESERFSVAINFHSSDPAAKNT